MKVLHVDQNGRIVIPGEAKKTKAWVPLVVSTEELHLVAWKPPKEVPQAVGKVVIGPDGWPVWDGEMCINPVEALNAARQEDSNG